jgi:hypothetical protein
MKFLGILLLAGGLAALIYGGFTYRKTENVLHVGDMKVDTKTREHVTIPPVAGGVAVAAGVLLLIVGERRRTV